MDETRDPWLSGQLSADEGASHDTSFVDAFAARVRRARSSDTVRRWLRTAAAGIACAAVGTPILTLAGAATRASHAPGGAASLIVWLPYAAAGVLLALLLREVLLLANRH